MSKTQGRNQKGNASILFTNLAKQLVYIVLGTFGQWRSQNFQQGVQNLKK